MKTLFVTRNYPPTICGIGDHTFRLAQELVQKGVEVHVVCGADQTGAVSGGGITVHPVVGFWNKEGAAAVQKVVETVRPDWAAVQYAPHNYQARGLPFGLFSFYGMFRRLNVPILTVFHEVQIRPWPGLKSAIVSRLQMAIADRLARASARAVTSIDIYAGYLGKWRDRLALIPVGSNIQPIAAPPAQSQKIRERFRIAPRHRGGLVVCTFGNRDISPFLAAFDRLAEDFPKFVWLICGRNPTPPEILSSRRYVRYAGEMHGDDLYAHLSLGDVFFTPDLVGRRGDGGTCNKSGSLACGCSLGIPIVGAKGDMNNALLVHGENILLVDIMDPEALSGAIRSCFSSETWGAGLGERARRLYDGELDWPVLGEKFHALMAAPIDGVTQSHPVNLPTYTTN